MKKNHLSIKIIYGTISIIYYPIVIIIFIQFIETVGELLGFWNSRTIPSFELPLQARFNETGEVAFGGNIEKIDFAEAIGSIRFVDASTNIGRVWAMSRLLFLPITFWQVNLFYIFITNVNKGRIFDIYNLRILQKLSYILLGSWVLMMVYKYILLNVFLGELHFENIVFNSIGEAYIGRLLLGMFAWILSHVFLYGVQLKQENELTI